MAELVATRATATACPVVTRRAPAVRCAVATLATAARAMARPTATLVAAKVGVDDRNANRSLPACGCESFYHACA
eukprot:5028777-Prymnesium_polylepis.1